jgi:anti-sigma-K factor RskA
MLAGVAAALVLVLAGLLLALRPSDPGAALYDRLMTQQDAREIEIEPALQPTTSGELVTSADGREAVIRVKDLPHISADQTFQLWLVDADGARSGGLFRFDNPYEDNFIVVPLEKPVTEYRAFGVSLEPAGGSPYPDKASGPRVFRVEVNA